MVQQLERNVYSRERHLSRSSNRRYCAKILVPQNSSPRYSSHLRLCPIHWTQGGSSSGWNRCRVWELVTGLSEEVDSRRISDGKQSREAKGWIWPVQNRVELAHALPHWSGLEHIFQIVDIVRRTSVWVNRFLCCRLTSFLDDIRSKLLSIVESRLRSPYSRLLERALRERNCQAGWKFEEFLSVSLSLDHLGYAQHLRSGYPRYSDTIKVGTSCSQRLQREGTDEGDQRLNEGFEIDDDTAKAAIDYLIR